MKKRFALILAILFLYGTNSVVFAVRPIRLVVGGEEIETDTAPVIVNKKFAYDE